VEGLVAAFHRLEEVRVDTTTRDGGTDGVGGPGLPPVPRSDEQRPLRAGVERPAARQQLRSFHLVHPLAGEDGGNALIGGPQRFERGHGLEG
jgi:hypothetical protein